MLVSYKFYTDVCCNASISKRSTFCGSSLGHLSGCFLLSNWPCSFLSITSMCDFPYFSEGYPYQTGAESSEGLQLHLLQQPKLSGVKGCLHPEENHVLFGKIRVWSLNLAGDVGLFTFSSSYPLKHIWVDWCQAARLIQISSSKGLEGSASDIRFR
ncbi:hypothetical protein ATANTOWER_028395 [Ataeniobius toweri]|uniref:Uncharacterized protein n=1 Tax=Ataeniobius toweri TaxID=208326 RepID=A0ABU7C4P3_9TELE|nr:hypothetical protein [Ataeniobius toweri]